MTEEEFCVVSFFSSSTQRTEWNGRGLRMHLTVDNYARDYSKVLPTSGGYHLEHHGPIRFALHTNE